MSLYPNEIRLDDTLGTVSSVNSSTTPLSGSATFTGTAERVEQYSNVTVMVDSDVDGTLKMQLSTDGTNWDRSKDVVVDQDISSGSVHTLEIVSKFFRVVYVNGSGAQSHFRLQTIYHKFKSGFLTSSPDEKISKINDAQLVRVSNDVSLDISRGLYSDKSGFHRFGHNTAVPNGSFADIWSYGPTDASYNWPVTAETFRIAAGGNAADSAAGAGARSIQIVYLDVNGNEQQEQLATAGASASAGTSVVATRFVRAWVDTAGTILSSNTGDIIIENSTSNQVVGFIAAGVGQTQMTHFTVPFANTAYLERITINVAAGSNKDADIKMWQRTNALTVSAPFGAKRLIKEWDAVQGQTSVTFKHLPSFAALTDIWFEASGNGAVTEVDVDYDLTLVKDESPTSPQ